MGSSFRGTIAPGDCCDVSSLVDRCLAQDAGVAKLDHRLPHAAKSALQASPSRLGIDRSPCHESFRQHTYDNLVGRHQLRCQGGQAPHLSGIENWRPRPTV
jgi:hypothetical protein